MPVFSWPGTGLEAIGLVAFKGFDTGVCEMKRLYAAPAGHGRGRQLAERLMQTAREAGHRSMVLDSLPTLKAACALYKDLGFKQVARYSGTPVAGVAFVGETLRPYYG